MTSKNRYLSLFKEDMKGRTLSIVLSSIVEFLLFPVGVLFFFQTMGGNGDGIVQRTLYFVNEPVRGGLYLVALCGAIICAYSGFSYLFHKKQVDFYHGLPYNRSKQFLVRYLNGYLVYLLPLLVFLLISLPIYMMNSGLGAGIGAMLVKHIVHANLVFLLVYNLLILGVMLAGNISNAGFVSLFLGIYAFLMGALMDGYFSVFLDTYQNGDLPYYEITRYLSPMLNPIRLIEGKGVASIIVFNLLVPVLSYFLFIHRKMEKAGTGAIYKVFSILVRFGMTVMTGLGLGLVFTVSNGMTGWMIFGILFGSTVTHVLINSLFNMSIKDALKGKKFLAVAAVLSVLTALAVRYDCFGYDSYLPSKEAVKTISIRLRGRNGEGLPYHASSYIVNQHLNQEELNGYYKRDYQKEMVEIPVTKDNDLAYQLIVMARDGNELRTGASSISTVEADSAYEEKFFSDRSVGLDVKIKLTNGGSVVRNYQFMDRGEFTKQLEKLYYSKEFREGNIKTNAGEFNENLSYVLINKEKPHYYSDMDDVAIYENENSIVLNRDKASRLYQAYAEDMREISVNAERFDLRNGRITFVYEYKNSMKFHEVQLTASHKRTLALLKKYQILSYVTGWEEKEIKEIRILDRMYQGEVKNPDYENKYGYPEVLLLRDRKDVQSLYAELAESYNKEKRFLEQGRYLIYVIWEDDYAMEREVLKGSEIEARIQELVSEKTKVQE